MWVKFEVLTESDKIIYLPRKIAVSIGNELTIFFGKKSTVVSVISDASLQINEDNSFENPLKLRITSKLAYILNLPTSLTYQIKYNSHSMLIGPTIGLLLGEHNYLYCPSHMEKYSDRFGIYNKIGGLIYAFSHQAIDWENKEVYGLYYDNSVSKWQYGKFPLPSVIYRRDFHTDYRTEKRLLNAVGGKMFNSCRFSKFYLYKHAKQDRELSLHLPDTELTHNYEQIKAFIDLYDSIILKPTLLSRGRGICIISKDNTSYKVFDYRNRDIVETQLNSEEELKNFFETNKDFFNQYLIQQHLKLAKVNGGAFDIRVVMQKEKINEWKCTGIECRVAGEKILLTNISRGGYALTLDNALDGAFPNELEKQNTIKENLNALCLKLCKSLESTGHHFAEFGMDIAVDENGSLWIIEVNVFPSFKGFKIMDYETYLEIRQTPIIYASHLAGF